MTDGNAMPERRDSSKSDSPETLPLLSVRDLTVVIPTRQGALTAIDRVSFDLAHGEVLGLVGESGAGKTLTGQAIIGLLEPPLRVAAGEVWLEGRRIDNLPADEMKMLRGRKIGMIFQDPLTSLNPLFRIGDQLIETVQTHRAADHRSAREQAIALLEEVGLPAAEQRMSAFPHQLSGGMRQRVVIALVLAGEPEVVIADEPTTALDVSVQAQVIAILRRVCANHGAAVILITHDMGVIAKMADRVAVIYAGRLAEIGPVRDIIQRPRHPYTAALIETIPNLHRRSEFLQQISGTMPRLSAIPSGCAFHPRCPHAFSKCAEARPERRSVGDLGAIACWLWEPGYEDLRNDVLGQSHGLLE